MQAAAREVSIPPPNMFLHSILQHYYVDGQDGVLNPIGMLGRKLEADFHIIHGVGNRIKNSVRCVKELDIEVRGRRLRAARRRAGGARSEPEKSRRARRRHGRRHDGLRASMWMAR